MPEVTATAACFGLRPVANALGWSLGMTYSLGIGRSARVRQLADHLVELRRLGLGDRFARAPASAILSLNQ